MKQLIENPARLLVALAMMLAIFTWGGQCTTEAASHIKFQTTGVTLNRGEALIEGYFYNSGSTGGYVQEVIILSIRTTDDNDRFIWADHDIHCPLSCYVAPGAKEYYTLSYQSSEIPQRGRVVFDVYSRTVQNS